MLADLQESMTRMSFFGISLFPTKTEKAPTLPPRLSKEQVQSLLRTSISSDEQPGATKKKRAKKALSSSV